MDRIPPSQKISKKVEEILNECLDGEGDMTTVLIRLGVERLVQELLEQEVTDYLERDHYQRRQPDQEHRGYRNGYEPGRMRTAEGEIIVQVPQVRDAPQTYHSRLVDFLRGHSEVLQRRALGDYLSLSKPAYAYLLTRQRPDGGFDFSERSYRILRDRRSYPRYLAMILWHLLCRTEADDALAGADKSPAAEGSYHASQRAN